ncbi:S-layer homology domain-containing protein [Paenibacillus oryzisoli]|uniref:SLH domain-containing protein n=1 Tax=Paenibacillus oryzisoli TaxID=1850517 RepID=A0A198ASM7_9BACL|nr:S-layer homology domain-containing protein [Paenibacillus oryzisoli]OAS24549.1 hypothetical protein A8708_10955 [Paenibacillus oryzisoli]
MKQNFSNGYLMKSYLPNKLAVIITVLCLVISSLLSPSKVKAAEVTPVTVYATDALPQTFYGFGAQFDPYVGSDRVVDPLTTEQWNTVMSRADYMRMGFARVATAPNAFSPTLTVGQYDWNTPEMLQLYKILDQLKSDGTTVLLTTWRMDYAGDNLTKNASETYVDLVVDALDYLINTKGYTNIKFYQHINEPKSNKVTWYGYKQAMIWLKSKLDARGLPVGVMATGNQINTGLYAASNQLELAPYLSAYDIHYYPSQASIANASSTEVLKRISDLSSEPKPLFITEGGTLDGQTAADDQPNVVKSSYALHQVDTAMQAVLQGAGGVSLWELDDAQHDRLWGMWDIFNAPTPRPWFYTYSLLSRYVAGGSTIYKAAGAYDSQVRVLVAEKPSGAEGSHWTIAAVNRGSTESQVNVTIPGINQATWDVYKYMESYHPEDAEYLPVKDSVVSNTDMSSSGVNITIPAGSFMLLTTYDQSPVTGTPVKGQVLPMLDNFNKAIKGTVPDGWETLGTGVTVQNVPSSANKSMRVKDNSTSSEVSASRVFPSQSGVLIEEFDIKLDQTNEEVRAGYLNNGTAQVAGVYFDNDGQLHYYNGENSAVLMPYSSNIWYHIKIVANSMTNKFDLYVDDMTVPAASKVSFKSSATSLDNMLFGTSDTGTGAFNVDNVKLYKQVVNDNFNLETSDAAPSKWTVTGSSIMVQNTPSETDKSMRVDDSSATGEVKATIAFGAQSSRIVEEFDIKLDQKNQRVQAGYLYSGSTPVAVLYFDSDGKLRYYNSNSSMTILTYNSNTWYHIKIDADLATNKFDVYVNDMNTPVVSQAVFKSGASSIDSVLFGSSDTSKAKFNVDNVTVTIEPAKTADVPGDNTPTVVVTGITVTSVTYNIYRGDTLQMNALVIPNDATSSSVIWSAEGSDDIATITEDGVLNAIGVGSISVVATATDESGITGSQIIHVFEPLIAPTLVTGITVDSNSAVIVGGSIPMLAAITPVDATNASVTWSVTTLVGGQATIDSSTGVLTGVTAGTVTVTATANDGSGIVGTRVVTITPVIVLPDLITVSGDSTAVAGSTHQYTASVLPANADDQDISWSVINETGTATISATGLLTAVSAGTVSVKATSIANPAIHAIRIVTITAVPCSCGGFTPSDDITPEPEVKPDPEPETKPEEKSPFKAIVKMDEVVSNIVKQFEDAGRSPKEFKDVESHWAKTTIEKFVRMGVLTGYEDGSVKPDGTISRAEFATIISRVFGLTGNNTRLSDINGHWAANAIQALAANGIIDGYPDGSFRPENTITRAEIISIISKLVNLQTSTVPVPAFTDTNGIWNAKDIQNAASMGLVDGQSAGEFASQNNSSRAEALTILLRALELNSELKALFEGM